MIRFLLITIFLSVLNCSNRPVSLPTSYPPEAKTIEVGATRFTDYLPLLKNQRVALVVNHTSTVGQTHLADTLQALKVNLVKIFAPEHGFRGTADAGELIKDGKDTRTGLPVISLYGNNKKPSAEQLADLDIIIFDIQDVGVRFYTYISTLHYVMEACAENNKKLIVLDRPNPNGSYIDGPVLKPEYKSFVGMHPIPIVHGLTVGELALMINGEGWLEGKKKCALEVITIKNWDHQTPYSLPIKPSPNLPNDHAIQLYPSICLFEGTSLSVGRGTKNPFEVIGHPDLKNMEYSFTPMSIEGMSKNPPFENKVCYGFDLRNAAIKSVDLSYLIKMYQAFPEKDKFFISYFEKLAGTNELRKQIIDGLSEHDIKDTWKGDISKFKEVRKKYLLYP